MRHGGADQRPKAFDAHAPVQKTLSHHAQSDESVNIKDDSQRVTNEEKNDDDEKYDGLTTFLGLLSRRRRRPRSIRESPTSTNHRVDPSIEVREWSERDDSGDDESRHVRVPQHVSAVETKTRRQHPS